MTVGILWAMLMMVQDEKSSRIILWITASVWESTDAVASSMKRILLCLSMTRPKHISWRWPTLQFSPLSTTKFNINRKIYKLNLDSPQVVSQANNNFFVDHSSLFSYCNWNWFFLQLCTKHKKKDLLLVRLVVEPVIATCQLAVLVIASTRSDMEPNRLCDLSNCRLWWLLM